MRRGGASLDDDFFPLNGHLQSLLLRNDFLAEPDFALLNLFLVRSQFFLVDLHFLLACASRTGATRLGGMTGSKGGSFEFAGPILGMASMSANNGHGFIITVFRFYRDDGTTRMEFTLVVFGFLFGNAHANEQPRQTGRGSANARTRQNGG